MIKKFYSFSDLMKLTQPKMELGYYPPLLPYQQQFLQWSDIANTDGAKIISRSK